MNATMYQMDDTYNECNYVSDGWHIQCFILISVFWISHNLAHPHSSPSACAVWVASACNGQGPCLGLLALGSSLGSGTAFATNEEHLTFSDSGTYCHSLVCGFKCTEFLRTGTWMPFVVICPSSMLASSILWVLCTQKYADTICLSNSVSFEHTGAVE